MTARAGPGAFVGHERSGHVLYSPFRSKILPMISQELLDMLVCPACKKPVAPKPDGKGLKCPECRRVYPIQDDIPIMLVDEAVVDPS
jgi:uncharacterized protein YbaR (Trm112 family)